MRLRKPDDVLVNRDKPNASGRESWHLTRRISSCKRCFLVSRVEPFGFSFRAVRSLYRTSNLGLRWSTRGSTGGSIVETAFYKSATRDSGGDGSKRVSENELLQEKTSLLVCAALVVLYFAMWRSTTQTSASDDFLENIRYPVLEHANANAGELFGLKHCMMNGIVSKQSRFTFFDSTGHSSEMLHVC